MNREIGPTYDGKRVDYVTRVCCEAGVKILREGEWTEKGRSRTAKKLGKLCEKCPDRLIHTIKKECGRIWHGK